MAASRTPHTVRTLFHRSNGLSDAILAFDYEPSDADLQIALDSQAGRLAEQGIETITIQVKGRLVRKQFIRQDMFHMSANRITVKRPLPRDPTLVDLGDIEIDAMPSQPSAPRPSLKGLTHFADLFGLGLRKRIKGMAGDYDAEIQRLHADGRYRMAKWNKLLAWGFAGWYVLRGPLDWLRDWAVKGWRGQ